LNRGKPQPTAFTHGESLRTNHSHQPLRNNMTIIIKESVRTCYVCIVFLFLSSETSQPENNLLKVFAHFPPTLALTQKWIKLLTYTSQSVGDLRLNILTRGPKGEWSMLDASVGQLWINVISELSFYLTWGKLPLQPKTSLTIIIIIKRLHKQERSFMQ